MSLLILLKTTIVYSFIAITLIGLITNSISFVLFSRKRFQNTIFKTYFRMYVVFQTLNLILPINKMFELNLNMYFSRLSTFICSLRFFYPNFNFSNDAWLLVVLSIDRYLSVSYPNKFLFRKNHLFQSFICCFIFLYNTFYFTSSWFYYLKETRTNETNQTKISYKCVPFSIEVDIMEMFQQTLGPFSFMILFTMLTIKNLLRSRKINNNNSNGLSNKTISNDKKFVISSIAITILFLLFNLPYFIFNFLNDYTTVFVNVNNLFKLLESLTYFFLYINLCSTFFINSCVNSMFKCELKSICFLTRKISI
jgi:hypothetical protein